MTAWIAKMIMKLCGWKFDGKKPVVRKAIILSAPHTSNWDFFWGKMAFLAYHIDAYIFVKRELFFFPLNLILKSINVLPIDRKDPAGMIKHIVKEFKDKEDFYLCIAPEGTRKPRNKWPRGFYFIAAKAKVPVYLGRVDYDKKELSLGELFYPTGNVEKDMRYIKSTYRDVKAKYPENFSLGADA